MANHMAEVAKMLGIELGEPFMVGDYKYHFTEKGLCYNDVPDSEKSCVWVLYYLLNGTYTIKRKPWKPSKGDKYWHISSNGSADYYCWTDDTLDFLTYKFGNCYRTREEAEANRDKWVAFYASDEVLEV